MQSSQQEQLTYVLVMALEWEQLQRKVNEKMKEGFLPAGGIVIPANCGYRFWQAMYRSLDEAHMTG